MLCKWTRQLPTMSGAVDQQSCVRLHWAKSLTGFKILRNNTQQKHPTTCNRVCKRTQHETSNNVGRCYWPTILRPFARSFTYSHPVGCFCVFWGVAAQSLRLVELLAPCNRMQNCWPTPSYICWELLRPFARIFKLTSLSFIARSSTRRALSS